MLSAVLLRLRRHALRRGATERSVPWLAIGIVAHLFHRALRDDEPVRRLRLRRGRSVTVTLREPPS